MAITYRTHIKYRSHYTYRGKASIWTQPTNVTPTWSEVLPNSVNWIQKTYTSTPWVKQ